MKLNPEIALVFDGQCEAAFRLYEQCMNGTITYMLKWGDSPMAADAPPGWESKICHATLKIGDTAMSGSDQPLYRRPQGFSLTLQMDDPAAAERIFQALAENGDVQTPMQETFWARRFGSVVDRFGIPWAVNCE
jgi:PhnB protein